MMKKSKVVFQAYLCGLVFLLVLWQAAAFWIQLPIIPAPDLVFGRLSEIFADKIAIHAAYSLWRIVAGILLAVTIGYPLGLIMGYFMRADRYLAPLVYLTYPVPKIALLPVLMLLAGVGELSKIIMIFLIVVFQIVVALRDGIRAIPAETYYPLYSLGAGFWQVFRYILVPATLPNFITAIRVAMATAVSVLFFTETFGTQYGMGYFIMDAWLRVNYLEMYTGIVILSLMGLLLFGVLDLIEGHVCRWQMK
ncbi:NitT/TauT family transport system permease protein [Selenomonas ruminantium]|uniref:NitT/TauT family transport system permease protein n=1 Tax=Selenomonas ruminantium TaxID=971 RepID=A0A1M6WIN3_SELRU|nr:ABC transporter permease [Selenomonas ruminantium]SHK93632.1 NitT/TauT family transport system permease protein [Selenomonas ruminantium]